MSITKMHHSIMQKKLHRSRLVALQRANEELQKAHEDLLQVHVLAIKALAAGAVPLPAPPVGGTAGAVWQIVWELSDDKENVRFNRSLSSLDVPFETLARRLNARFFGGNDKFSGSSFSKTTTVGDVVTMVEDAQEGK
jgi:hypothetical protein